MKIITKQYKKPLTPAGIARSFLFWLPKSVLRKITNYITYGETEPARLLTPTTWLHNISVRIWYKLFNYKDVIKIEQRDVYDVNLTLAKVIVPLLEKYKKEVVNAPLIYDSDLPENLKSGINNYDLKKWHYILDEMIYAFSSHLPTFEVDFYEGESDWSLEKQEDGNFLLVKGPKHTFTINKQKEKEHNERVQNGLRLFTLYYSELWL